MRDTVSVWFGGVDREAAVQLLVDNSRQRFGAICGYLFLGLGWAVSYNLIESFPPSSFAIDSRLGVAGEQGLMQPYLLTYYSFVTLTTVGYGDITPVSPVGARSPGSKPSPANST